MTIINCNSKGNCKLKFDAWNNYSRMGWRIEELEAVDILCMQGVLSTHPSSIMPAGSLLKSNTLVGDVLPKCL